MEVRGATQFIVKKSIIYTDKYEIPLFWLINLQFDLNLVVNQMDTCEYVGITTHIHKTMYTPEYIGTRYTLLRNETY